jgi:hypothetical protein
MHICIYTYTPYTTWENFYSILGCKGRNGYEWVRGVWLHGRVGRADRSKEVVVVQDSVGRRDDGLCVARFIRGNLVASFQKTEVAWLGRLLANRIRIRIRSVIADKVFSRNRNIYDAVAPLTELASPG